MSAYSDKIKADGAVAYWRLGESSGTSAFSEVGGYTGTISGGVSLGQSGALVDGDRAMAFNGIDGKVQISSGAFLTNIGTGPFTIEFWFNTQIPVGPGSYAFYCESDGIRAGFMFYKNGSDPTWRFLLRPIAASGSNVILNCSVPLADGLWHHIVMVFRRGSPDTAQLYVDGVQNGSTVNATTNGLPYGPTNVLYLATNMGFFFPGLLDEVAIYQTALTPAQIANHYSLRGAQAAAITGLSVGSVQTLVPNTPYALPGKQTLLFCDSGATLQTSADSGFGAPATITLTNGQAVLNPLGFIQSTGSANVVLKTK